jgi:hypothetical protein
MTDARTEIVEATTRMAVLTDGRRWDELPDLFTATVRLDYSALLGGTPVEVLAGDVAASWAKGLSALTTQHLVTNHLVEIAEDTATVTASFQATHVSTAGTAPWVAVATTATSSPASRAGGASAPSPSPRAGRPVTARSSAARPEPTTGHRRAMSSAARHRPRHRECPLGALDRSTRSGR